MTLKKNYSFSRFSPENMDLILCWVESEEDRVLWYGNSFSQGLNTETFTKHLERKNLFAFQLTNSNDEIHAYGEVVVQALDRVTLCRIIVKPSHRKQGLGKFLCECLILEINQWNMVKEISLNTLASNKAALGCYQSLGFKAQGIRKRSRRLGRTWHDLILMSFSTSNHFKK